MPSLHINLHSMSYVWTTVNTFSRGVIVQWELQIDGSIQFQLYVQTLPEHISKESNVYGSLCWRQDYVHSFSKVKVIHIFSWTTKELYELLCHTVWRLLKTEITILGGLMDPVHLIWTKMAWTCYLTQKNQRKEVLYLILKFLIFILQSQ